MMMMVEVKNTPAYAKDYKYIVARLVGGELWFYGAWDNEAKAQEIANQVDGLVVQH